MNPNNYPQNPTPNPQPGATPPQSPQQPQPSPQPQSPQQQQPAYSPSGTPVNSYFQAAPQNTAQQNATPKAKTQLPLYVALTILGVLVIGLAISTLLLLNRTPEAPAEVATVNDITIPLSAVDTSEDPDALKKALVGRRFSTTILYDETIYFSSDTEYTFSYYPKTEAQSVPYELSLTHGTYEVNGNIITTSNGEEFTIKQDYLVKNTSSLSPNSGSIYFDVVQYPITVDLITKAINRYLPNWGDDTSLRAAKAHMANAICDINSSHMTDADAYVCNIDFSIYFNRKLLEPLYEELNVDDFFTLCNLHEAFAFYEGGCSSFDISIALSREFVVRINDDGSYRITGIFPDEE